MPSARFFNRRATLRVVAYPQDAAGGEVPTPEAGEVLVPCCVQQAAPAGPTDGKQGRRGSEAGVTVFLRPTLPPQVDAVGALKVDDRITVTDHRGRAWTLVLAGPPHDASGRGVVWEAGCRDVR